MSAYDEIRRNHKRRHDHGNKYSERCKHCGSFVSKPAPEGNQVKYVCDACGRAVLEYVPQKQAATSD